MTGLRAREPGDISPGVGQFPKTHPMLLVSRFLSPHYAAAEPPQPVPGWTPPGDGMSDCHDQHEMLGVGIARRRLLAWERAVATLRPDPHQYGVRAVIDSPAVSIQ